MRKQIDDVDAQQAQNLELLARRLLLREHLLQDAVGLRALGCGRWNLLPRRQSDLPFRRCLSRCRDDCSPEATNEFYSSGPQPFEGFLWHGCVRSVNARETRTGDLRPGVAAAAGPHHPASSRSGPEGTVPHACMATASECDGHRDREDRDQHGFPGLARAVFVCHSHTVAAAGALRLPPAGDIAAAMMRVTDRRMIDARSLPPEEARAIPGSPSCRRCYRASRRKNSPPFSNARSLRRNSIACMPLLLLPLGRGWASGGPAALGPPSRIAHSSL